jgi:hypothetical protein
LTGVLHGIDPANVFESSIQGVRQVSNTLRRV